MTKPPAGCSALTDRLTALLRSRPSEGGIRNALQHMWGHIHKETDKGRNINSWSLLKLLKEIQRSAWLDREPYLLQSTALSELRAWFSKAGGRF